MLVSSTMIVDLSSSPFNCIHFYFIDFEAVRQSNFKLLYLPGEIKLLSYRVTLFISSSVRFSFYLNNLPADCCVFFMFRILPSIDNDFFSPGLMLWLEAPAQR